MINVYNPFNFKPELRENETVCGEYPATTHHVRGTGSPRNLNVYMWLTNQRLILKASLDPQRTLPLYALTDIREEMAGWLNLVRLEFASGHLEWLTVQNQAQFLQALRAAQAQAPEIPEGVSPFAAIINPVFKPLLVGFCIITAGASCLLIACVMVAIAVRFWLAITH